MAGGDLRTVTEVARRRVPRAQGLPPGTAGRRAAPDDAVGRGARDRAAPAVEGRAEFNALGLARAFDQRDFRRTVIGELTSRLHGGEVVAFPAALGIAAPHEVWSELEHGLGRPVFEVPTLPPSVPGMRVFAILRDALRRAGGSLLLNNVVIGAEHERGRVRALRVRVGLREERHSADWVVLATGGFASGGLELDSDWTARETALGLPVAGVPEPGSPRFEPQYFAAHPMARAGVAVDGRLRPVGSNGEPVFENVLVAGATLAGRGAVEGEVRRRAEPLHGSHGGRARAGGVHDGPGGDRVSDLESGDLLGTLLMRESLDHCVKCTICETFCPVSNVTPLFPGPKYAGPQSERFRVADEPSPDASLDYCSGCGICTQVCPQGVHIAEINTQARAKLRAEDGPSSCATA